MKPAIQPFICTHLPVPSSGDLYFTEAEAEEALIAFMALWQPDILSLFSQMPKWCRPDDIPSPDPGEDSRIFVVYCSGVNPHSAVRGPSLKLQGGSVGLIQTEIRGALGLHESNPNSQDDSAVFYPSIGLGILLIDTLFEAQNHSNLLQHDQVWACLQSALRSRSEVNSAMEMDSLREAANYLLVARESLSSSNAHLVDFTDLASGQNHIHGSIIRALGLPRTIGASGVDLVRLTSTNPEFINTLKKEIDAGQTELIGGCYLDRPESGLTMSSILWNLARGQSVLEEILGKKARIHYRQHAFSNPSLPEILRHFGLAHLVLPFDRQPGTFPPSRASIVSWSWGDAMGLESFAGIPLNTCSNRDMLHLARRFSESISIDYTPVLLFHNGLHSSCQAYQAFCRLSCLAPVFGKFTDMDSLFKGVSAGDYWNESGGCEFRSHVPQIDTIHLSNRNWLDTALVFDSLHRLLGGPMPTSSKLPDAEDQIETLCYQREVSELAFEAGNRLAERILRTGESGRPGFLLLNPSAFNRRVVVEIDGKDCLQVQSPVLASEPGTTGNAKAVVEIPGFGFAWIPRRGVKGIQPPRQRLHLADERGVRNEFVEAEFDPATGCLRGLRDLRHRIPRIQQIIQIGKGGSMMAKSTRVISRGPARGELVVDGVFVDGQGQQLGQFTQTMRAWIGRPLIELEIEVSKLSPSTDHAPSLRLFWKDQSAELFIGSLGQSIRINGEGTHSADYIHLVQGANATTVICQKPMTVKRHGNRSIELNMESKGEGRSFLSLGFAVDRDYPHLFVKGLHSPFLAIPVEKGPPASGTNGWLIHLDSPGVNLERLAASAENQIEATLVECLNEPRTVGLNFARSPQKIMESEDRTATGRELRLDNGATTFDLRRRGIKTVTLTPQP